MIDLTGRVAIVTGGSRGIGRAVALKLAALGARVVVNYQSHVDAAEQVVRGIKDVGSDAIAVCGDVSQVSAAQDLIDATMASFGRVDVLVNNAGITRDNLLMRMSEADWDIVLDTNLKGTFNCIKSAARPMIKQRYGRIVNVTSVSGLAGNAGQANYSAAKAGLTGLTKTVAKELGSRGVTCNAVAPGFIETELTANLPEELIKAAVSMTPLGRMGQVDDVANLVVFLGSDAAAFITGQVVSVDGGFVMQ